MSRNNHNTLPERIPVELSDHIEKSFSKQMDHDVFRKKVKEIVIEYIQENTNFMKKVKEYAKEEIETNIYRNIGYWAKTILIPIGVTIITYFILKFMGIQA